PACNPNSGNNWAIGSCPSVTLRVNNGELAIPTSQLVADPAPVDGVLVGGAVFSSTNEDGTGPQIFMNGTQQQLNDALALLTFTPNNGYENDYESPTYLEITGVADDGSSSSVEKDVEIRIDQFNEGPTLTVLADQDVAAGSTNEYPAVAPP